MGASYVWINCMWANWMRGNNGRRRRRRKAGQIQAKIRIPAKNKEKNRKKNQIQSEKYISKGNFQDRHTQDPLYFGHGNRLIPHTRLRKSINDFIYKFIIYLAIQFDIRQISITTYYRKGLRRDQRPLIFWLLVAELRQFQI